MKLIKALWEVLDSYYGCSNPPESWAWRIYNQLAGEVTCICCTFFRGLFTGFGLSGITALIVWAVLSLI